MPRDSHKFQVADFLWLLAIVLLALVPRWYLLSLTNFAIESDEAIVGLMAKHIAEGQSWPIFYYGQSYLGSLEALLVAIAFNFLGVSALGLKLVPLLFSLVFVIAVYLLSLRFTDKFGARVAAFLAAVGPSTLILWSTKARGGFIELVVIGTMALIISADVLNQGNPGGQSRPRNSALFFLGLVLGLGWWVNNQIIFYMAPIGLYIGWVFLFRYGIVSSLRYGLSTLIGFFIGGAPFWYANLFETPRFQTFETLAHSVDWKTTWEHFCGFLGQALPILIGGRRYWSDVDVFPGAALLVWLLLGFSLIYYVIIVVKARDKQNSPPYALLLLFLLFMPLIFSKSSFGWLSQAPRYLLPIYSVIFVVIGTVAASLPRRVAFLPLLGFLAISLASNYYGGPAVPGQPFVYKGERVREDQRELYQWLTANSYRHIKTNYWIAYRTAFETQERITASLFRGPQHARIPEYERHAAEFDEFAVYVLVPNEAQVVETDFLSRGYLYRKTLVGGYVVFDHVRPSVALGSPLSLDNVEIHASSRQDWTGNLIDSDLGTRWGSGSPQAAGMNLTLDLPTVERLAGLELVMSFWRSDAPRGLVIEGKDASGSWCELFNSDGQDILAKGEHSWALYFPPRDFSSIRVTQTGEHPVLDWSVAELLLYPPA